MPNIRQLINMQYYRRKIRWCNTPLQEYVDLLNNDTFFSFSRYGDGEWMAILEDDGKTGKNCDAHTFFPAMAAQLRQAITSPSGPYFFGLQNFAVKQLGKKIHHFISSNNITFPWHESDVFHHENLKGTLFPFIEALRHKEVVLIGPPYLRNLNPELVKHSHFIEVPLTDCFLSINEIEDSIRKHARTHAGAVYAFSASMATNCMIHHLYKDIGTTCWMLDLGSLWDGYLAVNTRWFCKRFNWAELLQKNSRPSLP